MHHSSQAAPFILNLRRRFIPLQFRKVAKRLYENFLWRVGAIPFPAVSPEPLTSSVLKSHLQTEYPTILELGASDGEHTLWFLNTFKNPRVFCFEPEPRAIRRFKERIGCRENVILTEAAISDQNGTAIFYQSTGTAPWEGFDHLKQTGWDFSGSLKPPKEHLTEIPWIKFDSKIEVPTLTLDSWLEKNPLKCIDFIWMDVQGAELSVFSGLKNNLDRIRYIYTEYNEKEMYEGQGDLHQILKSLPGFKVVTRYAEDVLLKNARF